MSLARRVVTYVLLVSFTFTATGIANAQAAQGPSATVAPASSQNDSMAAGLLDGELMAEGHRTGGKFGAGLGIGLFTGLVGTGIGYFVIGPEPLSAEALKRSLGKSDEYQLGLKTGWEKKTQSKKRNAFLVGGLLGTAALVTLFVAAAEPQ